MTFSIIMPTYNCEKYVGEAIESVLGQTFNDFELIIVDDGSQDGTLVICEELAKNKDNVHLFAAEHGGVSKARNFGLSKARGEYVLFIDGDDMWDLHLLESVMGCAHDNDSLLVFGIRQNWYSSDGVWQYSQENLGDSGEIEAFSGDFDANELFSSYNMASPCNKVFRKEIIEKNNLQFSEKCVYLEDLKFNFDYLCFVSDIYVLKSDLYHYRLFTDQKQMLKRHFSGLFVNADELYASALAFVESRRCMLQHCPAILGVLCNAYFNELVNHIYDKDKKEVKRIYTTLRSNDNFNRLLRLSQAKFFKLLRIFGKHLQPVQLLMIRRRF